MQYVAEPSEAVNTGLWGSRALLGSPHEMGKLYAKSYPNGCSWLTTALFPVNIILLLPS